MVDELLLQVLGAGPLRRPDVIMRLAGKRLAGQTTTFDLIVLITLAVAVQRTRHSRMAERRGVRRNRISGSPRLAALGAKSAWIRHLVRGKPSVLVRDGQVIDKALAREGISREELLAGLRKLGYDAPEAVKLAVLEETGHISAVGAADAIRPATITTEQPAIARSRPLPVAVAEKNCSIAGCIRPRASTCVPASLPPDHACPAPWMSHCSTTLEPSGASWRIR